MGLVGVETSNTLRTRSRFTGHGTVVGTIDPPKNGKGGVVKIAEEFAVHYGPLSAYQLDVMMTYGHELANLLDHRINPKGKNGRLPGQVYGSPSIIDPTTGKRTDPDTGQAVENCMKRKLSG